MKHTITTIRQLLLLEGDADIRRALAHLKSNLNDIHAWQQAHIVARRHGKVLISKETGSNIVPPDTDYIIRVGPTYITYAYFPHSPTSNTTFEDYIKFNCENKCDVDIVDEPDGLF